MVRSSQWSWDHDESAAATANAPLLPVLKGAVVTLDVACGSSSAAAEAAVDGTKALFSGETHVCPESAFHCFVPGATLSVAYAYPDSLASCWDMDVSGSLVPRDIMKKRVRDAVTAAPHAAGRRVPDFSSLKWGVSEHGCTTVLIDVSPVSASWVPPSVTSTMLALLHSACGAFFEARGRVWDRSPRDIESHVYTRALRPFLPPRPSGKTRAQLAQHMFDAYVRPAGQFVSPHHRLDKLPELFVASRRCSLAASTWPARAARDVLFTEDLLDLSKQRGGGGGGSWAVDSGKRERLAALVAERAFRAAASSSAAVSDAAAFVEDLLSFVDACAEEGLLDFWRAFRRRRHGPPWPHSAASGKGTRFAGQALEPCNLSLSLPFP